MTMSIRDDGKCFDTSHPKQGNGIKNMHKRAKEMGAFFTLESNPGAGTQIQLKIAV